MKKSVIIRSSYTQITLGVLLLITGCYEEPTTPGITKLLTQGAWTLTKWTSTPAYRHTFNDGSQRTYSNLFELYLPCRHDDEYSFAADPSVTTHAKGTYEYREGPISCGVETIRESSTFFMQQEADAVRVYFELPGSKPFDYRIRKIYTVEELTQNRLVFSYLIQIGNAVYTWHEEYKLK